MSGLGTNEYPELSDPTWSYEGQQYLPNGDAYTRGLETLISKVCGFIYPGDKQRAVLDTIRVLRDLPELAELLLSTVDNVLDSSSDDVDPP
jgi:hypothetical protein